jgi:hypothetical protein
VLIPDDAKDKSFKTPTTPPSKATLAAILNHEAPEEKMGVKEPFREATKKPDSESQYLRWRPSAPDKFKK